MGTTCADTYMFDQPLSPCALQKNKPKKQKLSWQLFQSTVVVSAKQPLRNIRHSEDEALENNADSLTGYKKLSQGNIMFFTKTDPSLDYTTSHTPHPTASSKAQWCKISIRTEKHISEWRQPGKEFTGEESNLTARTESVNKLQMTDK